MNDSKKLGFCGENYVAKFLENKGFKILEQNFRTRFGEIDIIAQKEDVVAFIEVKTRKNLYFQIASVVTHSKQKKIIATAKRYIVENNIYDKICRFDVATIIYNETKMEIEYIPNAFQES
ncbi:TPA: YraN family protein [Candidatus Dependentiae bacterium]|nr:MAG: hypothetical protein UR14_C0005G0088 [candidate division TM6 bacterium GW2011_GWE2_31_21]KKP53165.1 MAG: hypothetical protein UR43_C0007G0089 [candidate division TM6 bacterium GW2011_GWF2_33_332]HBS47984.1 YraN family protein [Candidatus Dependentiae bacterium]HBZ73412.1 YraN family protein [Candidatus Dependentiae bacterium]